MADISTYFNELNQSIYNAKTRKTLKYLTRRAKKIYRSLFNNALTEGAKKQVSAQYNNSMKLIKNMYSNVTV